MEKFAIRNCQTGEILCEGQARNFKNFVEKNKGNLRSANLEGANLSKTGFSRSDLSNTSSSGIDLSKANLEFADFRSADLGGANFWSADLRGANLEGTNLYGANLKVANLYGADLRGANLRSANLKGANLRGANLEGADLEGANLRGANLKGANLENCIISIYSKRCISIKLSNPNIEKQDINQIKIIIGCKEKTISEWDTWFDSDEEYETKRGTFEFKQIQAMYKAYRAYVIELWS